MADLWDDTSNIAGDAAGAVMGDTGFGDVAGAGALAVTPYENTAEWAQAASAAASAGAIATEDWMTQKDPLGGSFIETGSTYHRPGGWGTQGVPTAGGAAAGVAGDQSFGAGDLSGAGVVGVTGGDGFGGAGLLAGSLGGAAAGGATGGYGGGAPSPGLLPDVGFTPSGAGAQGGATPQQQQPIPGQQPTTGTPGTPGAGQAADGSFNSLADWLNLGLNAAGAFQNQTGIQDLGGAQVPGIQTPGGLLGGVPGAPTGTYSAAGQQGAQAAIPAAGMVAGTPQMGGGGASGGGGGATFSNQGYAPAQAGGAQIGPSQQQMPAPSGAQVAQGGAPQRQTIQAAPAQAMPVSAAAPTMPGAPGMPGGAVQPGETPQFGTLPPIPTRQPDQFASPMQPGQSIPQDQPTPMVGNMPAAQPPAQAAPVAAEDPTLPDKLRKFRDPNAFDADAGREAIQQSRPATTGDKLVEGAKRGLSEGIRQILPFGLDKFVDPDRAIEGQTPKDVEAAAAGLSAGLSRGVAGISQGLQQGGQGEFSPQAILGGQAETPEQYTARKNKEFAQQEQALQQQFPERQGIVQATKTIGEIAPTLAMPGGKVKSLLGALGIGTMMGATAGGIQYLPSGDSTQRLQNTLLGGALGMASSAVMPVLKGTARAYGNYRKTQRAAKLESETTSMALDARKTQRAKEAAGRLDTWLSPSEASQSRILKGEEARLRPTRGVMQQAEQATAAREQQIQRKMKETIQSVLPEGKSAGELKQAVKGAYEDISKQYIPAKDYKSLVQKDPVIQDALAKTQLQADKYPPGSAGRLIEAEKYLKKVPKSDKQAYSLAQQSIKRIQDTVEQHVPAYQDTRKLAQKSILHTNMQEKYAKLGLRGGDDVPAADKIYDGFFGNTQKQVEFLKGIKQAGGNTQQAKDLITFMSKAKGSAFEKMLGKENRVFTQFEAAQGPGGAILGPLRKAFMFKHDNAVVQAITNPAYSQDLNALKNITGSRFSQEFGRTMGKILTLESVSTDPKDYNEVLTNKPARVKAQSMINNSISATQPDEQLEKPLAQKLPNAVQTKLTLDSADEKKAQQILNMTPEQFYKEALSDEKKRKKLTAFLKKHGADSQVAQAIEYHTKALEYTKFLKDSQKLTDQLTKGQKSIAKRKRMDDARSRLIDQRRAAIKAAQEQRAAAQKKRGKRGRRVVLAQGPKQKKQMSAIIQMLILYYLNKSPRTRTFLAGAGVTPEALVAALSGRA